MVLAARVASEQSTSARIVRDPCGISNEMAMIENRPYRYPYPVNDADAIADRRSQLEREQQEHMAERQKQIALQTSPFSSAEERVRLWENLHALALPRSPSHKLLRVIAEQTELAIEQVLEIQRARFAPPALPVAAL
jgi:hypothetical protein